MSATPLPTARPAPPVVRMDGLLPDSRDAGRSFDSTATAVTPPDRLDPPVPAAPRPIVADAGDGFDWTAGGIGFAAASGIALFGAGSLMTARWRRHGRTLAH